MTQESCPICGSYRTSFSDSYSDGEERVERPFSSQECVNRKCGLPCKFWQGIKDMIDVLVDDGSVCLVNKEWCWSGNYDPVFQGNDQ